MKKMTTIRIDPKTLREAQELGINISKFTENALKLAIAKIKEANNQIAGMGARLIIDGEGVQIGDLEVTGSNPVPGIPKVDWQAFKQWLRNDKSENVVRDVLSYARRYRDCLFSLDLSEVRGLNASKRRLVLASLSNLAKFLGKYDEWRNAVRRFGVKWVDVDTKDRRIIERITRNVNVDAVYSWLRQAKQVNPTYVDFLDFIALTGLRFNEAIQSWNLIHENLSEYYNNEKEVLEHYRFKEHFMRKGKKAFISFVPCGLIERIRRTNLVLGSRHTIAKHVGNVRFSDLREAWASIMTKYLSQAEIDFLQGRVGTSVFMQNYFNPALISDLRERVFKGIVEIEGKINATILPRM